eukprot:TRINITY_DN5845_c0_g1_i1.p2 TRINITY_DN5845_c0_g1~~TRINITY_DN5845_c0_g1_i1.p2  ORF type:complete len:184 (+),score=41.08 TRINITY_DN5845_c0_g1_i1:200-751(+)
MRTWVCLSVILAASVALEVPELEREVINPTEECDLQVQKGDEVSIVHKGYYGDQQIDGNPQGPDGKPEPLKFVVGAGVIIEGMEQGVVGTCLNEEIRLTIPPHLAFDDGRKNFQRKPVPDKSTVVYDITVVDILRPGSLRHTTKLASEFFYQVLPLIVIAAIVGGVVLANSKNSKSKLRRKRK